MADLPTVRIQSGDRAEGWIIINATDFDPKEHKLFEGESLAAVADAAAAEGEPVALDDMTLDDLKQLASERDIKGRSKMNREELIEALR